MGARRLETRLTLRLFVLAGSVTAAVALSAIVVTHRMLDASDTDLARSKAKSALDALEVELAEGDSFALAAAEVREAAGGEGVRVELRHGAMRAGDEPLAGIADGSCVTLEAGPWRACRAAVGADSVAVAVPIAVHRAAIATLVRGMLGVLLVAFALVWIAIRTALRAPLAELRALVDWTARMRIEDAPDAPPTATTREIAQLEAAFDALVRRLLDALARERASSAHIAHELRTPLTAMRAELASVTLVDDASRAAIARVREDVARFSDVIDAIVVLSSDGRTASRPKTVVNLADVARELAPSGAAVEAPDEALVDGDEQLVRLALRNLIDNARRYAHGARVVSVRREGSHARVGVTDDGHGVDEAARDKMFERYWRGVADAEGRGLGLALVRAVAERHGGSARADRAPRGAGLEVSFTVGELLAWSEARERAEGAEAEARR